MTRLRLHNDAELGPVEVIASDPTWPWFLCGFLMFAAIVLMFAGAVYFAHLAHNANPSHPVIAEPK